jgi:c-di-GMP-binding flagellar brake protein YcgR
MEIDEKRLARRLRVHMPVAYEPLNSERGFHETIAKDISTTGLRMNTRAFIAPQTHCRVHLTFPEVNKSIETIARVVWSQRISYSDQYQAGFQFTEIAPVQHKWLEEYILINEALPRSS